MALETATSPVTVNAICPGWVPTPLVQKAGGRRTAAEGVDNAETTRRLLGEKQPSLAFTTPEQLGGLAVFLCSRRRQQCARPGLVAGWRLDGAISASQTYFVSTIEPFTLIVTRLPASVGSARRPSARRPSLPNTTWHRHHAALLPDIDLAELVAAVAKKPWPPHWPEA